MLKSISKITLIALLSGAGLLVGVIWFSPFLNIEGLAIVVGGSVANAYLSARREDVRKAFASIRDLFAPEEAGREALHDDIKQFIHWSYVVNAEDYLGLERESMQATREPLMRYGMDLVITGYPANDIREMMQTVSEAEFERRTAPVAVLRNMAATAPAFGMVGTLIGMVLLLKNVGTDISILGSGLGIAMLATLYGLLAARLICLPAADKMLLKEESIRFRNYLLTEGFGMLAEKQKAFYMLDRLNSFLEPARHCDLQTYRKRTNTRKMAMAA